MSKETGTVKFFKADKGFGFIVQDNGGEIFFHKKQVKGTIPQRDQRVEFEVGEGKKGLEAKEVELLS